MNRWLCSLLASAFLLAATEAGAAFHMFQIEQIYSNADGTVQFVVMHEFAGTNGENFWAGHALTMTHAGAPARSSVFQDNLPSATTAGRRVLIATPGFAALNLVKPDYTMPSGFLATDGGTLNYAGFDTVTYAALPTDGANALNRGGNPVPNLATNFAGQSASVTAVTAPIVPVAGVWWNPNESGSGFGLDYQGGTLLVEVYSYLADGATQWYLATGPLTNNVFHGTLDRYRGGQCISCAYKAPTHAVNDNDGDITITFTSPTTATADLPGGRHIQIQRFFQ